MNPAQRRAALNARDPDAQASPSRIGEPGEACRALITTPGIETAKMPAQRATAFLRGEPHVTDGTHGETRPRGRGLIRNVAVTLE